MGSHKTARKRCGADRQERTLLNDPDAFTLKRIAWAYGCAKTGSLEEDALRMILVERCQKEKRCLAK